MEEICKSFETRFLAYGANCANKAVCEMFVPDSAQVIAGYQFTDPRKNYKLLSENDFSAFHPRDAEFIHKAQRSPFGRILLILYYDNNCYLWKIMNGMASNLIPICEEWADKMNNSK